MFTVGAFAFSQYLFGGELNSIPDARDDDITLQMNQGAQLYFLSQLLTKKLSFYPKIWDEWARDLLNLYKHCRAGVRAEELIYFQFVKQ